MVRCLVATIVAVALSTSCALEVDGRTEVSDGGTTDACMQAPTPLQATATLDAGLSSDQVRWTGRVDDRDPSAARFSWQGSGLIATVRGSTIAVKLRTEAIDTIFYQVVLDGEPGMRVEVPFGEHEVIIASDLTAGDHEIALYRDTEGGWGISTFLGFTRGSVRGSRAGNGRLIEVVGDSISAGYGALGSERHDEVETGCLGTSETSPWYQSYAAIAGHALAAEVSTIARSGWGLYRDGDANTSQTLPSQWDHRLGSDTTSTWDFARKPNAVVINLGTNDWTQGDPGTPFETAYVAFLIRVRTQYPDAWIFLTIGSMFEQERLDQVKARLARVLADRLAAGDGRISTFDFGSQDPRETGCLSHPSAAEHRRMAGILQQELSAKLGW